MTRQLSPAEHRQRVEAARARWYGHTPEAVAGSALIGAGLALGADAARRHVAREGAKILAQETRAAGEPAALAADRRAATLEQRVPKIEAWGRRAARQAKSDWPFERLYQQYGREARLDRLGALDIDTGRPTTRTTVTPGFEADDAALLRARAKQSTAARQAVAPHRDRKTALVAGAAWNRQAATWQSRRKVKVDPLATDPAAKADFARRVALLMTPAPGVKPLTRQAAEKEVRNRVPAYRFRTETRVVTHNAQTAQGARRGHRTLRWPDGVDRPTAEAVGERIALQVKPPKPGAAPLQPNRLTQVSQRVQALAAQYRAQANQHRAAAAEAAQGILRAAPRRLTVGRAGAVLAAGAAAGVTAYAAQSALRDQLGKAEDVEALAKAAEDDDGRDAARSLGAAFRRWLDRPAETGDPAALDQLRAAIEAAFQTAAGRAVPPEVTIGGPGGESRRRLAFEFDERSPDIERQAQQHAAALVTRISNEARNAIRQVVVRGTQEGLDIPTQARLIRESIGLTAAQAAWVQNYRNELEQGYFALARNRALRDRRHDRVLDRVEAAGGRLDDEQIERMVASYHRRLLAFRATTIARTEAVGAANIGRLRGVEAFLEQRPDVTVIKRWIATDDERTRPDHIDLNGREVVGLHTPFLVTPKDGGAPYEIRFPHDPLAPAHSTINCRCTWSVRVVPAGTVSPPAPLVAEAVQPAEPTE